MKKSAFWIIILLFMIGFALLAGLFIGRVTSGDRIHLEKHEGPSGSTETTKGNGLIDINTADISTLTMLPGIGETLAKRIIAYRDEHGPYTDVEQLLNVAGIGETKLENIIDYIKIGD